MGGKGGGEIERAPFDRVALAMSRLFVSSKAHSDEVVVALRERAPLFEPELAPTTAARFVAGGVDLDQQRRQSGRPDALAAAAEIGTQKPWADTMTALLVDAKRRCDAARAAHMVKLAARQRSNIRASYDNIVTVALAANPAPPDGRKRTRTEKIGYNLAISFRDHQDEILRFVDDLTVSFDNNQSERDLRMARLQTKISGSFRSQRNAKAFATVRSYIETGRKHGANPIEILLQLFQHDACRIPRTL